MKRLFLTAVLGLAIASAADACPSLGVFQRARSVSVSRTVTTAAVKQTVSLVPVTKAVTKTVLVPTQVTTLETKLVPVVSSTPVTTTRTVTRAGWFGR